MNRKININPDALLHRVKRIDREDITELNKLLMPEGVLRPVDYYHLKEFSQGQILCFCAHHGFYQIITTELVDFIKSEIGSATAIEIGAGNGCLGRALGIRLTDNKMQLWPEVMKEYIAHNTPPVRYGKDVEEINGNAAVDKYQPSIVVASWVTQKYKYGLKDGNEYGVDECLFKGKVKKYIHVGNHDVHKTKEIIQLYPYKKHQFEWLVSRGSNQSLNYVYIFDCT